MPWGRAVSENLHLEVVTLCLPGKRAAVKLPPLILALLVDRSENSWTMMGCTTRGAGTGRNGGAAALHIYFLRPDRSEETMLLV